MYLYKTILVGLDGSENAGRALHKAIALEKAFSSRLIVFHAVEYHRTPRMMPIPMPFNPTYAYTVADHEYTMLRQQQLDAGKRLIEDTRKTLDEAGVNADIRLIEQESPDNLAMDIIEQEQVDVILIGCKGHSKLQRTFMGSVADKLVNEAPCDVIVVR